MTSEMKALCIKNATSVAGAAMFVKAPDLTPTYDKKAKLTNTVYGKYIARLIKLESIFTILDGCLYAS
jgi:hypothetical protein